MSIVRGAIALLAAAVLMGGTGRTQQPEPEASSKRLLQDTGLPGIDRGLREHDRPREPRGRETRALSIGRDGEPSYLSGSVIVKFRTGTGSQSVVSAMRDARSERSTRPSYADFEILDIPADDDPEAVAAELQARGDVEYAQPRYINYPMFRPNDPLYDRQWNLHVLEMERAWEIQPAAGDQITVAVLDSGMAFKTTTVRYNSRFPCQLDRTGPVYPAMGTVDVPFAAAPELGVDRFVAPRDFIWNDDAPLDLDGHGTHVSGTIGQLTNNGVGVAGMAFNVRLMPVKVIDDVWDCIFDSPATGTDDVVARGIRYAADNGARVINMSIGRSEGGPARAVEDAIRYAVSRGVFVAVAAGNTAERGNPPNRIAAAAPGIAGMVAVAAVGRSLGRAYYSTINPYVELAAPGGDQRRDGGTGGILQQTLDQDLLLTYERGVGRITPPRADAFAYYYFQGTSMATPHVAAFAALLMQQGITSPAAIEAAMKQFARDLGPPGVDSEYGHGLIQPRTTLRGLGLAR
jgi:serine protease